VTPPSEPHDPRVLSDSASNEPKKMGGHGFFERPRSSVRYFGTERPTRGLRVKLNDAALLHKTWLYKYQSTHLGLLGSKRKDAPERCRERDREIGREDARGNVPL